MRSVTKLIALFSIAVTCYTCDSGLTAEEEFFAKFHKRWYWIQTIGGFGGWETTPEKSGMQFSVDFKRSDSVKVYRNDTLTYAGKYTLKNRENDDGTVDRSHWALWFDFNDENFNPETVSPAFKFFIYEVLFETDTLWLYPACSDCFQSRFVPSE